MIATEEAIALAADCTRTCGDGSRADSILAAWLDSVAGRPDRGIDWDYAAAYAHALFAEVSDGS